MSPEELENTLNTLDMKHQIAFLTACTQRLVQTYGCEETELINNGFELAWNFIETGKNAGSKYHDYYDQLDDKVDENSSGDLLALASAIEIIISSIEENSVSSIQCLNNLEVFIYDFVEDEKKQALEKKWQEQALEKIKATKENDLKPNLFKT